MANMNKNRMNNNLPKEDKNTKLNHEGAVVHKLNGLEELFSRVQGSYMGEGGFYEKSSPEKDFRRIQEIISGLSQEDAEYALKIAAIGREGNAISYPLAVLTACYNDEKYKGVQFADENGVNKLGMYSDMIIRRGKDITEILANQFAMYGFDSIDGRRTTPIPKQERKNLKRKLEQFDEYKIAKALGKNSMVSMADAVKLLRPANKSEFFKSIIEGNVKFANGKKQVQSEITKVNNKNSESTVKDVKKSIEDSSLMAIVKNLVAMNRAGAIDKETAKVIADKLNNEDLVRGSRIMPYQLYDAYKMYKRVASGAEGVMICDALIAAIDSSVNNVDEIEGYTAFFVDLSGSMGYTVSGFSSTQCHELAALLAAIGAKKSNAKVYAFADSCQEVHISRHSTVVDITEKILHTNVGGCTYLIKALNAVAASGEKFDNVVVLTDGDCYSYSDRAGLHFGNGWGSTDKSCDNVVNKLIKNKVMKRIFVNNLKSTDFTIVNTDDYRKNLVTGFTERYIDEINFSILLEKEANDIRKIIDILFDKYYGSNAKKKTKKVKRSNKK